jgi:hypothetical protein
MSRFLCETWDSYHVTKVFTRTAHDRTLNLLHRNSSDATSHFSQKKREMGHPNDTDCHQETQVQTERSPNCVARKTGSSPVCRAFRPHISVPDVRAIFLLADP